MFVQEQQSRRQLVDVSWHVLGAWRKKDHRESEMGGFHGHGGTPSEHWMVYFMEILLKWMMKWGTIFQETYINLGKL